MKSGMGVYMGVYLYVYVCMCVCELIQLDIHHSALVCPPSI